MADATGIAAGARVLDLGCGSGEFCRLAAARGAHAAGIAQRRPHSTGDGEIAVPLELDAAALERALLAPGPAAAAIEHAGEPAVRAALVHAAAPFQRRDGFHPFNNRFRHVIATVA